MKLLSLNIEGHKHLDKVIPFLQKEQTDIVCLQEVFKSDLPRLAEALGNLPGSTIPIPAPIPVVVFSPMVIVDGPNRVNFPLLGEIGLAIISKFPIESSSTLYYHGSQDAIPHINMDPNHANRLVLAATFEGESFKGAVATTHFTWAPDGTTTAEQHQDLDNMFAKLKELPPHTLAGDFNAPRGSTIWQRLTDRYIDNIPPEIITTLDPHLHRIKNLNLVVDGLFSSKEYNVKNVEVVSGLSDHQAILAEIS